jgi:protein-S-isoprenylcysteine O-methyltransferase Ste14
MRTRIAAIVMLSTVVFFVVSLVVSLGLWWWTGDVARGVFIGVICGAAAAFAVGAVGRAMGRSGERSSDEHKRSGDGHDR